MAAWFKVANSTISRRTLALVMQLAQCPKVADESVDF
jgi:hypothetical protein